MRGYRSICVLMQMKGGDNDWIGCRRRTHFCLVSTRVLVVGTGTRPIRERVRRRVVGCSGGANIKSAGLGLHEPSAAGACVWPHSPPVVGTVVQASGLARLHYRPDSLGGPCGG